MSKVVAAKTDFEVFESEDTSKILYKSHSKGRAVVGLLVGVGAGMIGILILLAGIMLYAEDGDFMASLFLIGVAFIATTIAMVRYAGSKKTTEVGFDRDGVTKAGKKYLYSDISALHWRFGQTGTVFMKSQADATLADLGRQMSGVVFFTYGNASVVLIDGLTEFETEKAFKVVKDTMNRFGANIGDSALAS